MKIEFKTNNGFIILDDKTKKLIAIHITDSDKNLISAQYFHSYKNNHDGTHSIIY